MWCYFVTKYTHCLRSVLRGVIANYERVLVVVTQNGLVFWVCPPD